MTNEAIFQMECIVTVHTHAIHLLYHRAEGDLQRREYALQYGLKYNVAVLHNQLLHLPVVVAFCKKAQRLSHSRDANMQSRTFSNHIHSPIMESKHTIGITTALIYSTLSHYIQQYHNTTIPLKQL